MLIVPFRADTLDRSPANRSRARSGNRPVSSTITRSYPDAWPAVRSADKVSSEPVELSITPGYGERRIRMSRFDASAISRTCRRSSPAFSLLILAIAPRQPGRRSGPTEYPSARTAAIALLPDLRAVLSAASCASHDARSQSTANSGSAIGSPLRGCPGGTISVFRDHCASAPTGSAWSTSATTGGRASSWCDRAADSRARCARLRSVADAYSFLRPISSSDVTIFFRDMAAAFSIFDRKSDKQSPS